MSLSIINILTAVKNLLDKNNTTTSQYDISANLERRVVETYKGVSGLYEHKTIPKNYYPCIFVELDSASEDIAELGNSARRDIKGTINIIAITMLEKFAGAETADIEIIKLSENIQKLLRNKITLSGTVDYIEDLSVDYNVISKADIYNNISKITITFKILSD